jgi:hypothetical protein
MSASISQPLRWGWSYYCLSCTNPQPSLVVTARFSFPGVGPHVTGPQCLGAAPMGSVPRFPALRCVSVKVTSDVELNCLPQTNMRSRGFFSSCDQQLESHLQVYSNWFTTLMKIPRQLPYTSVLFSLCLHKGSSLGSTRIILLSVIINMCECQSARIFNIDPLLG